MSIGDLAAWLARRRLGLRLRGKIGGWLRWAIDSSRRLPETAERWITRVRRPAPSLRVVGPVPRPPELDDRQLLDRLVRLAPGADEARLRGLLDSLPADRGLASPHFPLDTYLSASVAWRRPDTRYLQRLVLDRRPSLAFLDARHGGSDERPSDPASILVDFDPGSGR